MARGLSRLRHRVVIAGLAGAALAVALIFILALGEGLAQAEDEGDSARRPGDGGPKNVILLIGDGTGESELTIARNYQLGAAGRFALDGLPYTGDYTTYSVKEDQPNVPEYYPESASTATSWSTGRKTSNGRISTSPGTDRDLPTVLEIAQRAGYKTGDVTTARLTDATPAAPASHVRSRRCEGPQDMAECPQDEKSAGGPGSIAEQQVDHGVNVLLGGGKERYEQTIDSGEDAGETVVESARGQGYRVVDDAAGLESARRGKKLLGLFNPPLGSATYNDGNMSLEWNGQVAAPFPGTGPQECQEGQRPEDEPSLSQMTSKAIELLDQPNPRKPGFFLQVEGASIDKQDHAANPCAQIGETVAFNAAVKSALSYQKANPKTLVIVTGDHAHTSQIVSLEQPTPGLSSVLTTADGADMRVNYGTGSTPGVQQHTGAQIRVAAKGPYGDRVEGLTDQTDLFSTMAKALGVRR